MQAPGLLSSSASFSLLTTTLGAGFPPLSTSVARSHIYTALPFEEPVKRIFGLDFFHGPGRASVGSTSNHGKLAAFASLGFTADPRAGIERAANGLLKDAAALLVYQEVLRSPPGQAFLKVILALRRSEDGWKLLEAYGEFYKLMAIGHYPSWEDFILEGILAGEGNPFAEAAANVGNPRSNWSGGVPPSLQAAAAADLDSLQRLSITESTLVGWVTDLVTDVRPEWRAAAESSLNSRNIRKTSTSLVEERNPNSGAAFLESDELATQSDAVIDKSEETTVFKDFEKDDVIASERERWRKRIGGLWRWSDAVPLLEKYYADFSIGRIPCAQALQCKGGKLVRDFKYCTTLNSCELSVHNACRDMLFRNFRKHASRSAAHHILVCGPSGSGKTWLVKSVLHSLACQGEIRVVTMPTNEVKNLNGILEELARNWQLRFVLVADDLPLADDLVHTEWPDNVLLCVTNLTSNLHGGTHTPESEKSSALPDFSDIFGMILNLENLDMDSYLLCVEEILKYRDKNGAALVSSTLPESIKQQAVSWANHRKVLSVRAANQFVKSIF